MGKELSITATKLDPALLDLPWSLGLKDWPVALVAALPKGISRHLVKFITLSGSVIAIKETSATLANAEYQLLRQLQKIGAPSVKPVAVITDRYDESGTELSAALVTRHLKFSMPYRALFSRTLRPDTATRLVDAQALLMVRLHLLGFYWGDVSLSNTLFRRDAGEFAAYLVDAETGQLHPGGLSKGQRENDLEIARVNIAGELMDLAAGGRLDANTDPVEISERIVSQYRMLWQELTGSESFESSERWRINDRVHRLNELGFDIEELSISADESGTKVQIQPKVVDSGHHQRRLMKLTGLDAEENQARKLLNDLDSFIATHGKQGQDEEMVAHQWLSTVFEPVVRAIPKELSAKLEPAELFYQLLEHRWKLSEDQMLNVPLAEALSSYIDNVLRHRRDEVTVLNPPTLAITLPITLPGNEETEPDWRDLV